MSASWKSIPEPLMVLRQFPAHLFTQASPPHCFSCTRSFSCNSRLLASERDFVKQARSRPYQRSRYNADAIESIAKLRASTASSVTSPYGVHFPQMEPSGPPKSLDLRAQGASRPVSPLHIIKTPQSLLGGARVGHGRPGNLLRPAGKNSVGHGRSSDRSGGGRSRQELVLRISRKQTSRRRKFEDGTDIVAQEETLGEKLYNKAKKETEAKEAVQACIARIDFQTLVGQGPSTVTRNWGLSEVVEERLDRLSANGLTDSAMRMEQLTRKVRRGEFVRFKDGLERGSILKCAQAMTENKQETIEQHNMDFEQMSKDDRAQFLEGLLKGVYVISKSKVKEPVLHLLSRYTTRNGSYLPEQGDSLAEKVKKLLSVQAGRMERETRKARAQMCS